MTLNDLSTLAMLESYIYRHENHLGFKPACIGVTQDNWKLLRDEARQHMRYTEAVQPINSLSINDIPIINCGHIQMEHPHART